MKNYTAGIEKNNFWSSLLHNHPIITIITNFESVTDWNFWWKQFAAFFHSSVNGLPPHCVMWRCHCDDSKIVDIRSSLAVLKHTRHQVWLLIQLISVDFYLIENNSFCLSAKKSRHWFISGNRTLCRAQWRASDDRTCLFGYAVKSKQN